MDKNACAELKRILAPPCNEIAKTINDAIVLRVQVELELAFRNGAEAEDIGPIMDKAIADGIEIINNAITEVTMAEYVAQLTGKSNDR